MKKIFLNVSAVHFLLIGVFSVCVSHGQPDTTQSDSIKITYIANEGFLLESSGKKVLIDALFTTGGQYYMEPPPQVRSQIINGDSLFEGADVLLVTHSDGDHFNASFANEYLAGNSSRYLFCTNEILNNMRTQQD